MTQPNFEEQARKLYLGFQANLNCPDVSPTEYIPIISQALRASYIAGLREAAQTHSSLRLGRPESESYLMGLWAMVRAITALADELEKK